jgi:signal transduction histidine kinase
VLLLIVAAFAFVLMQEGTSWQAFSAFTQLLLMGGICIALLAAYVFFEQARRATKEKESLLENLSFKEALLDALPDAYLLIGPQGQVLKRSGLEKLLGNDRISIAQDLYDLLQPASAEKLQHHLLESMTREPEFRLQITLRQQGKVFQAHGIRQPVMGHPPNILVWLRDVTRFAEEIRRQGDILHQANHQLHEFRAILNRLPFPIWQRAPDLKINWCNDAYARAVGQSADAVLDQQIELVPPAQGAKGKSLAALALEQGNEQSEERHVVLEGERRLLRITESGMGAERLVMGYALDRTQEAELDSELRRHIKAHEEVLEQLGTPIAIYSADTRLTFYNRSYVKLWDSDETFLKTEPTLSVILEDLRSRRRAPEQADFQKYKKERLTLFTSLIEPREDLMHLPDGTTLRIMAVPHPFGGIMFVHEDVTDKLALESNYNTLIAVQRETLDHLAEGIAVCGSDGRLKLYNPAFLRIWKLTEDVLIEHPHVMDVLESMKPLLQTDDWPQFKRDTVAEMLDRTTRAGSYERTDGSVIEYSCVPLPDGAVLVSYLDVSDTVLAEQALRETNIALAAADRLKSEFVANVSYQLRTPLNTIMGFAEILANQYFGTLNERQLEYARTMMEASKKLLHLINDVLDLATIEAGRMALSPKTVSVRGLLDGAADMTRDWVRQQELTVTINCSDQAGSFEADEHRMKQVMFNLISNAIQYTPAGGHITITGERQGEWVAITVEDDGMGIPAEDQERIFEKFERANPQARKNGAGLGLSLVRSFIELHGGRITIDSRVNEGTKITCHLPVKISPRQARTLLAHAG